MKALTDLKEILEDQVKKITKKGDITPAELTNMNMAVDIIKDIDTIEAMKKAEAEWQDGEYSQRGYSREHSMRGGSYADGHSERYLPYSMYSYAPVWNHPDDMHEMHSERMYRDGMSSDGRRGRDADNDGRYSETGSSYRRGRDARGRYTSRDYRYSRAEAKDRMIEKLEKMMNETTSAKDREIIKDCIEDLEA